MKESGWIRHDIGARNDVKIQKMVWRFGVGAKAIYWDLIEMLAEENGKLPFDTLEYVTYSNGLKDTTLAENVVKQSGLFQYNQTHFWSSRLLEEIRLTNELKEKRRRAGEKSGEARSSKSIETQRSKRINMNTCSTSDEICSTFVEPIHNNTEHNNNIDNSNIDITMLCQETVVSDAEKPQVSQLLSKRHCQNIVDFWNKSISDSQANLSKVAKLTEAREKKLQVRWKEFSKMGDPIEIVKVLFSKATHSKFFQGDSHTGWSGSFDWIMDSEKHWVSLYEGKYDDKTRGGSPTLQVNQDWEGE